jgi:hypothetical protein
MPAQRAHIHGLARPALGIPEVEAGAERFCAAGEHDHRGFGIILKAAGGIGELTQRLRRQRIDAVAAVEAHHGNAALGAEALFDRQEIGQLNTSLPVFFLAR